MAAPAPTRASTAAKKGVDTKRRLKEATSQAQAIAVSASVAKDTALEDAAAALMTELKKDPVLLFTVKGCLDNGTLSALLMGSGQTTPAPTKRAMLRDSVRKWKDLPQYVFAEFASKVSPAVGEQWQNSAWGELDYIAIVCHALHVSAETAIDFKSYPAMKNTSVLVQCMIKRHEQMGSRIACGIPADMRYWFLDEEKTELVLRVCGIEARFRLWLPSMDACSLKDAHILEKGKISAPKFGIDVTCLQLVLSGDYEEQRAPVSMHLIGEAEPWQIPPELLSVAIGETVGPDDSVSAAPSSTPSSLAKRKSLMEIEARLKSKARTAPAAGSAPASLPP
eukprot:3389014-Amphidinium_carterae.1